jgi:hypothetical protein
MKKKQSNGGNITKMRKNTQRQKVVFAAKAPTAWN